MLDTVLKGALVIAESVVVLGRLSDLVYSRKKPLGIWALFKLLKHLLFLVVFVKVQRVRLLLERQLTCVFPD